MPRQIRLTKAQRLEREMKAQFILDEAIASAKWLEFKTHLTTHTFAPKVKCPCCRITNSIDLNCVSNCVGECPVCYETKPLLQLPCHSSHSFCKDCLTKLI